MEVKVLNQTGKATAKNVALSDAIFAIEPNDHAIYLDVKQHLANRRQGTHKAKERSEVSGSTRKIKKQKGTGGARAGSIKSGVFKQGGNIHGPVPRDYTFKLNKKLRKLARKSALAYKAKENGIKVLENFSFEKPKTKEFVSILKNLEADKSKTLVVVPEHSEQLYRSSRNLEKSKVVTAATLNTYDILNAKQVIILEGSLEKIETNLKN